MGCKGCQTGWSITGTPRKILNNSKLIILRIAVTAEVIFEYQCIVIARTHLPTNPFIVTNPCEPLAVRTYAVITTLRGCFGQSMRIVIGPFLFPVGNIICT